MLGVVLLEFILKPRRGRHTANGERGRGPSSTSLPLTIRHFDAISINLCTTPARLNRPIPASYWRTLRPSLSVTIAEASFGQNRDLTYEKLITSRLPASSWP